VVNERTTYPTVRHYQIVNSKLDEIAKYINKLITKSFNQSNVKDIYPMVDHIDVYELEDINYLILRIYVNDPEMDEKNMYDNDFDPHYLVDYHFRKFLPYIGVEGNKKTGFAVVRPDGMVVTKWMN
jgi:hypothetical protein